MRKSLFTKLLSQLYAILDSVQVDRSGTLARLFPHPPSPPKVEQNSFSGKIIASRTIEFGISDNF